MKTFAQLLRESRQALQIDQGFLAHVLGVSQAAVSGWERDSREPTVPWRKMPELIWLFGWTPKQLGESLGWYGPGGVSLPQPGAFANLEGSDLSALRQYRLRRRMLSPVVHEELANKLIAAMSPAIAEFADEIRDHTIWEVVDSGKR